MGKPCSKLCFSNIDSISLEEPEKGVSGNNNSEKQNSYNPHANGNKENGHNDSFLGMGRLMKKRPGPPAIDNPEFADRMEAPSQSKSSSKKLEKL